MAEKIKVEISPNEITGLKRQVEIAQIAYLDWDIQEAQIKFRISHLDAKGEEIKSNGFGYEKFTHISNANKVTEQGVMITREFTDSTFVEPEKLEEGQTIEQLKQEHYDKIHDAGIPEFDMWMNMALQLTLEGALVQGIKLLDSFKYFD